MHHRKTYMYINFLQNLVRSVITAHTNVFTINRKFHKFATTNNNLKKLIISDMRHRKTYMYINFQQNRVSRSAKTVPKNYLPKNCKLHKIASCN